MAHVVCQVIGSPDRITLTWSEGAGAFDPYEICGQAFLNFKKLAASARERLSDMVKEYLSGTDDDLRRASLELARVGSKLSGLIFRPDAGPAGRSAKIVKKWLDEMVEQGAVTCLEIVTDGAPAVPWNLLFDGEPVEQEFLSPDASCDPWAKFWGLKFDLAANRRVEPLRRLPVMRDPRVLMVVDQVIQDGLPEEQRARLLGLCDSRKLPIIRNRDALAEAVRAGRPDLFYWLCHADPTALILNDEPITPNDLLDLLRGEDDEKLGGIAFLNACQTAESTEQGSFLEALQEVGLSGIIATEHQTIDTFANPLGLDFLEAFLDTGQPVGAILRKLRSRVPLGLLYGTYCPPGLRVGKPAPGDRAIPSPVEPVRRVAGLPLSATAPPIRHGDIALPEMPYRSLASYDRADRALFAGREADIRRFARLLDASGTRVVILHGESGVGKSSFLKAGVIPFLEEDCIGYRFTRGPARDDSPGPVLFIRATQDLAGQLAAALSDACSRKFRFETPRGESVEIDLSCVIERHAGNADDPHSLREVLLRDPATFGRLMGELSHLLPFASVLVIDQAEEIFTLAQGRDANENRAVAIEILRATASAAGNFKVIVSLRTEYFGRLVDRLRRGVRDATGVKDYLLTDFDEAAIAEVIRLPTSEEPVAFSPEIPAHKYGFRYAEGVPETIARDVTALGSRRRDSALPLVQMLCVQLYEGVMGKPDATITLEDYKRLGGVEGGLRRAVETTLESISRSAPSDLSAIKGLFVQLRLTQPDGSLTTALVPEDELARRWRGRSDFSGVVSALVRQQLLRVDSLRIAGGQERRYISLGHDALAKAADEWDRELRAKNRIRAYRLCAAAAGLILLTVGFIAVRAMGRARTAAEEKRLAENRAREHRYDNQMEQAQQVWQDGDVHQMRLILDSLRPGPGEEDLRGFEWRYLDRIAHSNLPRKNLPSGLSCAAIAADGGTIALGRADGMVELFDPKSEKIIERLRPSKGIGPVAAVAITHDGSRIAAVESNTTLVLWERGRPSPIREITAQHPDEISLAFTPDGTGIALGTSDKQGGSQRVTIWDYARGQVVLETPAGPRMIQGIAFSRNGRLMAFGRENEIVLFHLAAGAERNRLVSGLSVITSLAFNHEGNVLASGHRDGSIVTWDHANRRMTSVLRGHKVRVDSLSFAAGDKIFSSSSVDTTIRLWNVERMQSFGVLRGHEGTFVVARILGRLPFDPDLDSASLLAVSGEPIEARAGQFHRWHLPSDQAFTALRGHRKQVWDVACTPDGSQVVTAGEDGTVRVWNRANGSESRVIPIRDPALPHGQFAPVISVSVSPKGGLLAAGRKDGVVELIDLTTPGSAATVAQFRTDQGELWRVRFLGDGKGLVTSGHDMSVKLWDLTQGYGAIKPRTLWTHDHALLAPPIAVGGSTIASAGLDGAVHFATPGREPRMVRPSGVDQAQFNAIAVSRDGSLIALGDWRGRVLIFDVATEQFLPFPSGHVGPVVALAFTDDGQTLASGGDDTSVKIWKVGSRHLALTMTGTVDTIMGLVFLPGNNVLASASMDGFGRLWKAERTEPERKNEPGIRAEAGKRENARESIPLRDTP